MADKIKYIQASEHTIVGESGGVAAVLAPGERVLLNEDAESHKTLARLIEAEDPSVSHLSLIEVDPKQEKEAEEEKAEQLKKAAKLAAEQRKEEALAAQEELEERTNLGEQQSPHSDPTDFPPQDQEAIRLAEESAEEEEDQPKQGRRTSKKGG